MKRQLVGLLATCVLLTPLALAQENSAEKAGLDKALESWTKHFNDHDAVGLSKDYTEDADAHFTPGEPLKGRVAIEKYFAEVFKKNPNVKTKLKAASRRILSPGIAVEDGTWEEYDHTEKGQPTKGIYTAILVKKNDRWLLLHDRSWPSSEKTSE